MAIINLVTHRRVSAAQARRSVTASRSRYKVTLEIFSGTPINLPERFELGVDGQASFEHNNPLVLLFSGMELKEIKDILSDNRVEDDMLISLKLLILQRAKIIGHEELANKFDLKTLRALGFLLMEFFKGKAKDLSLSPGSAEPAAFIDGCNLLKCDNEDIMSVEELETFLDIDSKKRPPKRGSEEAALNQKKQKS